MRGVMQRSSSGCSVTVNALPKSGEEDVQPQRRAVTPAGLPHGSGGDEEAFHQQKRSAIAALEVAARQTERGERAEPVSYGPDGPEDDPPTPAAGDRGPGGHRGLRARRAGDHDRLPTPAPEPDPRHSQVRLQQPGELALKGSSREGAGPSSREAPRLAQAPQRGPAHRPTREARTSGSAFRSPPR